jgi:hypothetical protein
MGNGVDREAGVTVCLRGRIGHDLRQKQWNKSSELLSWAHKEASHTPTTLTANETPAGLLIHWGAF